jgi:hypothetical protein
MSSGLAFTITGSGSISAADLRSLRSWMIDTGDLRGPVELRQRDPGPGELGSLTDALVVAAGSGGAVTALAGVLVSWIRHRTSDLTVKVTRPDGSSVEVDGKRIRRLEAEALTVEIERLAEQLTAAPAPAVEAPDQDATDART